MKNKLMLSVLSLILLNLTVSTFAANQVLQGLSKSDMEIMEQLKQEISNKHVYQMDFSLVSQKFASKTYMDVLNVVKPLITSEEKTFTYEGRTYEKIAVLHAAVHDFATRTKSGYAAQKKSYYGKDDKTDFTLDQKLFVLPTMYSIITQYSYNTNDRVILYNFALNIVKDSKVLRPTIEELNNGSRDIIPGLSTPETRQEARRYEEKHKRDEKSLSMAMLLLPKLSANDSERNAAADAIYKVIRKLEYTNSQPDKMVIAKYPKAVEAGCQALYNFYTLHAMEKLQEFKEYQNSFFKLP